MWTAVFLPISESSRKEKVSVVNPGGESPSFIGGETDLKVIDSI